MKIYIVVNIFKYKYSDQKCKQDEIWWNTQMYDTYIHVFLQLNHTNLKL